MITDLHPLCESGSKKIWGYAAFTRSIGTGKASRLTIKKIIFDANPIKKMDIVYADDLYKNRSGWWYLLKYHTIFN